MSDTEQLPILRGGQGRTDDDMAADMRLAVIVCILGIVFIGVIVAKVVCGD